MKSPINGVLTSVYKVRAHLKVAFIVLLTVSELCCGGEWSFVGPGRVELAHGPRAGGSRARLNTNQHRFSIC